MPVRLRWSDLDAYNHVNNARLLSLLEEARVRAFWVSDDDASSPLAVIDSDRDAQTQAFIARSEVEYLAQIPYQAAPIDVQLWVGKLGAASFDINYEVWSPVLDDPDDTSGRVRYAIASTTLVFFDLATQRPRRIRDEERNAWADYVEAPVEFRGRG